MVRQFYEKELHATLSRDPEALCELFSSKLVLTQETLAMGQTLNETYHQQQWRHAKPYVQMAEDDLADADALAASCPTPAPQLVSAPVPPAPVAVPGAVRLSAQVVFEFDRFGRTDIRGHRLSNCWRV